MSTYPNAFDATFPGYPYVDETEFLDQTQANAWVASIQAIQTTLGYGTAGTPANPLYSAVYAATYTTVTARIAALESTVSTGGVKLNTAANNIQSVGATNQAGSTGYAADAGHVHAGQPSNTLVQVGTVFMWPGLAATFPAGCLLCNGQLVSTSTYAALFGIISYNYGGAGGSFALPNYNDRFPIGVGTIAAAVGSTGGSTTITTNNMPSHMHTVSVGDIGHAHGISGQPGGGFQPVVGQEGYTGTWAAAGNGSQYGGGGLGLDTDNVLNTAAATASIPSTTTSGAGAGSPYTQPYLGTYFLIRAI